MGVNLGRVDLLLLLEELFVLLLVLLRVGIDLGFHLVEVVRDEDAAALASSLGLRDEEDHRRLLCVFLADLPRG